MSITIDNLINKKDWANIKSSDLIPFLQKHNFELKRSTSKEGGTIWGHREFSDITFHFGSNHSVDIHVATMRRLSDIMREVEKRNLAVSAATTSVEKIALPESLQSQFNAQKHDKLITVFYKDFPELSVSFKQGVDADTNAAVIREKAKILQDACGSTLAMLRDLEHNCEFTLHREPQGLRLIQDHLGINEILPVTKDAFESRVSELSLQADEISKIRLQRLHALRDKGYKIDEREHESKRDVKKVLITHPTRRPSREIRTRGSLQWINEHGMKTIEILEQQHEAAQIAMQNHASNHTGKDRLGDLGFVSL